MTASADLVADEETLRALARLDPGPQVLGLLRTGQLSKRMLLLAAVRRTTAERAPLAASRARLDEAYAGLAALRERDPARWERVVLHPYLGAWAAGCLRDPLRARLSYLADLVSEAAPENARRPLLLEAEGLRCELVVDDADPMRDQFGHLPAGPLGPEERRAWQAGLTAAWEVLAARHRPAARTVEAHLTTVVPLLGPPDGRHVSASARECYGAVAASRTDDPALLALTLVHESLHVQLGALLALVRLHEPDPVARHRAPWRPDLRPFGALLQGAYAHTGVALFWLARARTPGAAAVREHAGREYRRHRANTLGAVEELLAAGRLTAAGGLFVQELRNHLLSR